MANSITFRPLALLNTQSAKRRSLLDFLGLARQRRALDSLDAHLLNDVGIAPDDARLEAKRPVWDVPAHWRE